MALAVTPILATEGWSGGSTLASGTVNTRLKEIQDYINGAFDYAAGAGCTFDASVLALDYANDRVGVGTNAPAARLHVVHNAGEIIRIERTGASYPGVFRVEMTGWATGDTTDLVFIPNNNNSGIGLCTRNSGGVAIAALTIDRNGNVALGHGAPAYQLHLSSDSAAKPSTNTWTVPSDARLKRRDLERPYTAGLDALLALPAPIHYTYSDEVPELAGLEGVGWNAQALVRVMPSLVRRTWARLGGVETEVLGINTHDLQFVCVNALRELAGRVRALEAAQIVGARA
jgi:hypothetical protein